MTDKPEGKPSGRVIAGADGKEEHVLIDDKDKASVERAHGYDTAPGTLYNAIRALSPDQAAVLLAQSQAERERIMALEGKARDEAIAKLAKSIQDAEAARAAKGKVAAAVAGNPMPAAKSEGSNS